MKATKNNGTFESINMVDGGTLWTATRGDYEVFVNPACGGDWYLATLYCYNRPMVEAEGESAKWALHQLAKECKATTWASEYEDFYGEVIFPLSKDLNDFMKRPPRETYNSR